MTAAPLQRLHQHHDISATRDAPLTNGAVIRAGAVIDRMLRLVEKRRSTDGWRAVHEMRGWDVKELEGERLECEAAEPQCVAPANPLFQLVKSAQTGLTFGDAHSMSPAADDRQISQNTGVCP